MVMLMEMRTGLGSARMPLLIAPTAFMIAAGRTESMMVVLPAARARGLGVVTDLGFQGSWSAVRRWSRTSGPLMIPLTLSPHTFHALLCARCGARVAGAKPNVQPR